ncbi:MAG TPA: hypothetical protein PLW65_05595 [Pseudomonadota bacterium]|nr:hypothetical protein [Pseudomonadota bacterium]
MRTTYDPSLSLRAARKLYFAMNNFGDNGGYDDAWVDFKLGPIPFPFPNTAGRVRAVKYHDLHHILTGYRTDLIGEFEISAWELGAGCRDFYAAWALNLGGLFAGLVSAPRRIARAFARGLASQSLYGHEFDELLDLPVGATSARFVAAEEAPMTATGWLRLALAGLAGLAVGTLMWFLFLLLLPLGLWNNMLRKKSLMAAAKPA